jgi:hypothetical protein
MRDRPRHEVKMAAPEDLDREVAHFEPHLIVVNKVTPRAQETVTSVVRIMYEDSLKARVYVDNQESSEVQDISMKDLLGAVDETERIVSQD